jgi:cytochrome P450
MEEISFSTILAVVLGTDSGLAEARIRALFPRLMDLCRSPLTLMPSFRRELGGLSPYGRLMGVVEELDDAIYAEITMRRKDAALEDRRDLLSVLARAKGIDGEPLSDRDLRDEIVTLLMAGWETTTSALAWAFERLARHPEAADRLAASLEEGDRSYLGAVVQETLRQRPVIPALVRKLAAPFSVGEFLFPARWVLMPAVYLLHHDPSTYPDPHEFRPERFLDGPPPGALWIPFGGGVRRCLGVNLAELEMRVVIETAITRLELRPTDPRPERPRRERFTLTPGAGAVLVARRRRARAPLRRRATASEARRARTSAPDAQRTAVQGR